MDYEKEAARTQSEEVYFKNVPLYALRSAVRNAIGWADELGRIKAAIFYNRQYLCYVRNNYFPSCLEIIIEHSEKEKTVINLIHAILGIASEAGEMLERLQDIIEYKNIDDINMIEEAGDLQWYVALLARTLNITINDIQEANIAKLRKRYAEKFTTDEANNRNINVEIKAVSKIVNGGEEI